MSENPAPARPAGENDPAGRKAGPIGLKLTPRAVRRLGAGLGVPLARRAWDIGIDTFELTGAGDTLGLALALRRTLPEVASDGFVLVGWEPAENPEWAPASKSDPTMADQIETYVSAVESALGGRPPDMVEFPVSWWSGRGREEALTERSTPDSIGRAALVESQSPLEAIRDAVDENARLFNVPHNLLEPFNPVALEICSRSGANPVVARDVHAGGRLNGGDVRLTNVNLEAAAARPLPLVELQRLWAPVARLSFLTAGGKRTLAQAAIQFALQTPGVTTAMVDVDGPERLEELVASLRAPPLTDDELARIRRGAAST